MALSPVTRAFSWLLAGSLAASTVAAVVTGATPAAVLAAGDTMVEALGGWQAVPPPDAAASPDASPAPAAEALPQVAVLPARELAFDPLPDRPPYTVYVPEGPDVPRQAVVVLHGMGASGPGMAGHILPFARAHDWVVIAPTMPYSDAWQDPTNLTGEEMRLLPQLNRLLDYVRDEAGVKIADKVMLFGFSRGAQEALRFTLLYPERVQAVAAFSAGTYTLPISTAPGTAGRVPLAMPYGTADLAQLTGLDVDPARLTGIRFLIGAGSRDTRDGDVPRQWDQLLGTNRLERARRFAAVLTSLGCDTQVLVADGAAHEIAPLMVQGTDGFLESTVELVQMREDASASAALLPPLQARQTNRADRGV